MCRSSLFFKLIFWGDTRKLHSDGYVHYLDCGEVPQCICVSKLIEWHAKYMQSMNVSYASIKQFFKNTHSQPFEGFSLRGLSHKSISTHPVPVALSSLFCTFHPSLPQSWKTHCAEFVFLPLFCSFYYDFLEKGQWNSDSQDLASNLSCIESRARLAAQLLTCEVGIMTTYSLGADATRPGGWGSSWVRWEVWECSVSWNNTEQC